MPHLSANLITLLPELVLTVTGIIIMLAEPMIAPGLSRKPLGWVAIFGTALAGIAAYYQLRISNTSGPLTGFYGTIQVPIYARSRSSGLLLIAAIVLVTLLGSAQSTSKTYRPCERILRPRPLRGHRHDVYDQRRRAARWSSSVPDAR